jgi:hypothetical protein
MSRRRLFQRIFGLTLVVLLLAACGGAPAELVATSTPVPPTATPTRVPPTATATAALPTATPTQAFTLATSLEEIAGTTAKMYEAVR